ncbi:MAG: HNH endonuclease, partial [Acidimicrobiaceae bacterium]|nr:HNH endonuclease [Acidimicrobiaceae bacterium]
LWCQAHHIIWWSNNGPTNLENLVLVCNDCHHKIHDDGWQVHKHPDTGKYFLKPPTQPPTRPAEKPLSAPSGERSLVSSDEPPTRQPKEHPTASARKPSTHKPSENSTVSSGEVSTISTDRADRARTRADSAQPVAGDSTESTGQNARGHAHGEQAQRKNQTSSHTKQQHPAARITDHDPVDGIDTS